MNGEIRKTGKTTLFLKSEKNVTIFIMKKPGNFLSSYFQKYSLEILSDQLAHSINDIKTSLIGYISGNGCVHLIIAL